MQTNRFVQVLEMEQYQLPTIPFFYSDLILLKLVTSSHELLKYLKPHLPRETKKRVLKMSLHSAKRKVEEEKP